MVGTLDYVDGPIKSTAQAKKFLEENCGIIDCSVTDLFKLATLVSSEGEPKRWVFDKYSIGQINRALELTGTRKRLKNYYPERLRAMGKHREGAKPDPELKKSVDRYLSMIRKSFYAKLRDICDRRARIFDGTFIPTTEK